MKKDVLIYFDLLTSLKTTKQATLLASEIDTLTQTLFKSEKMSLEKALTAISATNAQKIMQAFSENNLDTNDKDVVRDFLDTLKSLIKKFKIIKLVLAFDPTLKTIEKIHNFVKEKMGIGYILDIDVSQDLIGGAIVIFNGKYNDFTLRKRLEDVFANEKEAIVKLLYC